MGNLRWFGSVNVNYRSDVDCANDAFDSYAKVNARIGVSADNWEIIVYGRNITDEAALQQSFDTPVLAGTLYPFHARGCVLGVRGTLKF